jgi:SAM-dependent methyltransferase
VKPTVPTAVEDWKRYLRAWGIPEHILAAAPESPWSYPVDLFAARAAWARRRAPSPSDRRALDALSEGGSLLDVGSGAGAASLALVPPAGAVIAVDASEDMLAAFAEQAGQADVASHTVVGTWPEVAGSVEPADVVVCHHVLYNVQDLAPFVEAMTGHAARRVVVEITAEHPRAWMNDLWMRFHGLPRPDGPTADVAETALRELGVSPRREDWVLPRLGTSTRGEAVAAARRRLCLTADRDPEVADALGDRLWEVDGRWSIGPPRQPLTTLWWEP